MNPITDFIHEYYDIIYKGGQVNQGNLDEVEEFLLADSFSHGDIIINSTFINLFSQSLDCVMVQEVPALKVIQHEKARASVWLKTQASIVGWDCEDLGSVMGDPFFQKNAELNLKIELLIKKLFAQSRKKACNKAMKKLGKAQFQSAEWFLNLQDPLIKIGHSFSRRIDAMIFSLLEASKRSKRRFCIAEKGYLTFHPNPIGIETSLERFYSFLRSRNVVILVPKEAKAEEVSKERKALYVESLNQELERSPHAREVYDRI